MANKIAVEIVSADKTMFSGDANLVVATATTGELGVMHGHTPLLASLKAGHVILRRDEGDKSIYVSGGFLEVQPNKVTVLANAAEYAEDIDQARIEQAIQAAQEKLKDAELGDINYNKAQQELVEASARLSLIKRLDRN